MKYPNEPSRDLLFLRYLSLDVELNVRPGCLWNHIAHPLTLRGITDSSHKHLPGDRHISDIHLKQLKTPFQEWTIKCNQLSSSHGFLLCSEHFWVLTITVPFVLPFSVRVSENTHNFSLVTSVCFTKNRQN